MAIFWYLAFALAWALTIPQALAQMGVTGSSPLPWQAGILIGLAPAIAAIVAAARDGRSRQFLKSILVPRGSLALHVAALLLPVVALAVAYLANPKIPVQFDGSLILFGLLWFVLALGEEIGWRGYALPRLVERFGFWWGSAILGVVWCVWHFPRLLGSPFVSSLADAAPLIGAFAVQIFLANFLLCWLFFRARRTVLAPILFHAAMNVVATAYFMAATDWAVTAFFLVCVLALALVPGLRPSTNAPSGGTAAA